MDGYDYDVRKSDWLFWIYNAYTLTFILLAGWQIPHRWRFFLSNLGLILLSVFLIVHTRRGHSRPIRFLRNWYPFLYFFYLHWESGKLISLFVNQPFDPIVKMWDLAIFGDYLHEILYQFQPMWFAEFIHFTYFFYYPLLLLPAFLLFRKNHQDFSRYIFDVSLLYLIHYTLFYLFPVLGPIEMHAQRFPQGFVFIPVMKLLYTIGDSPGGAMPSSHISVAILAWYWLWKIRKSIAISVSFFTGCLIFSTVYLSYHYAIDSVVGFGVGILFIGIITGLEKRYGTEALI